MAKFRLTFDHYKSNVKLNSEGRRGFKQEKLTSHNGTHKILKLR